jgi:homoserine dehydrogenase
MTPEQMIGECAADLLLEATPVNLADGEPGLGTVRAALGRGMHVVLANKGPLALAYPELTGLSDLAAVRASAGSANAGPRPRLRFSATAAGALPVINIGRRDFAGDQITRIEAVLNGTTQSILRAMEHGLSFDEALADAQARGIAEADPELDIDGHDAACKLVITANAVLGLSATLADVAVHGIRDLSPTEISRHRAAGKRIVLLCLAEQAAQGYRLSVRPTPLPDDHPLARLSPDEMGVVYYSGWVNRLFAASLEPGATPASAAMLRDVLDIVGSESCHAQTGRSADRPCLFLITTRSPQPTS